MNLGCGNKATELPRDARPGNRSLVAAAGLTGAAEMGPERPIAHATKPQMSAAFLCWVRILLS